MSESVDVSRRRIEFDLPEHLVDEALLLEEEMGSSLGAIALSALESYIEGVRDARLMEEGAAVTPLPRDGDETIPLEGTESWWDQRPIN